MSPASKPARLIPFPVPATSDTDESLLRACARGDNAARAALYDRHHRAVFRLCARLCGRSGQDVEDLVQTTFMEVFRAAPKFSGRSRVSTWILGIATNLVRHDIRGRTRKNRFLALWSREPEPLASSVETLTLLREGASELERALLKLGLPFREAFILCDVEGMKGADAAEVLGVPEGTVWRRLHEARKSLRTMLEEVRP